MGDMDDEVRKEVFGEALFSELRDIRGLVEDVPDMRTDVSKLTTDMAEVKDHLGTVGNVVREHSRDIAELKRAS
jgi:hypothetical protein